jgi:hypothetical protein
MTDRKPAGESWESFAERKIREAQADGAFDRLPGLGKPIPDLDEPYDENWWIKKKLRREKLTALPPILAVRLEVEKTLAEIEHLAGELQVRRRLDKLNEKIRAAHFSPIAGPPDGVRPLDVEAVIADWHQRRGHDTR